MWPAPPARAPHPGSRASREDARRLHPGYETMRRHCPRSSPPSPPSARPNCRRSSRAGSIRSTRPAAGRCSSSSPARLRIGVSARLAKTAAAALGDKDAHEIELIWPGLAPPYVELFAWLEGRADKPRAAIPRRSARRCWRTRSRTPISPRSIRRTSWPNGNGTASACRPSPGTAKTAAASRGSIRAPARTFPSSFPDLIDALRLPGAIDGELLIVRDGRVQSFNVLQQRLNRKPSTPKLLAEFPAHLRAYDLLVDGDEDLRERAVRRTPRAAGRHSSRGSTSRASICRRWCRSRPGTSSPPRAPIRPPPAPAPMPRRSKASCSSAATRPTCRAARKGPWWKWKRDPFTRRCGADVCAARPRQALVVLFRLHVRRLDRGRGRRRAGAGRQGLFRLHRRGARRRSTASCAATPSSASARCARWCTRPTRGWCSRSRSRGCSARPGTSPASPCAFPASAGCAGTSRRGEADRLETLEAHAGEDRNRTRVADTEAREIAGNVIRMTS